MYPLTVPGNTCVPRIVPANIILFPNALSAGYTCTGNTVVRTFLAFATRSPDYMNAPDRGHSSSISTMSLAFLHPYLYPTRTPQALSNTSASASQAVRR